MEHNQFEDWEVIHYFSNTSTYADSLDPSRPPQHNPANLSSQQFADTTSAAMTPHELALAVQARLNISGFSNNPYAAAAAAPTWPDEPNYNMDHKPPSNLSQQTGTTATTTQETITMSHMGMTTPFTTFPYDRSTSLTSASLAQHQYELEALSPAGIRDWLERSEPIFAHLVVPWKKGRDAVGGRSKPSQASDGSYVQVASPNSEVGRGLDIRDVGARFMEESINPLVYASLQLEV